MNNEKKAKDKMGKIELFYIHSVSIHLWTDCVIFSFTPECRLPEKRLDSLVDRIFSDIFREKANLERRK